MKKYIFYCLFMVVFGNILIAQSGDVIFSKLPNWEPSFERVQRQSEVLNRYILIYFTGSDWCGPCKLLDVDFFKSEEFLTIAEENFILYKADSPRNMDLLTPQQQKDNSRLKSKFNISSYPTLVILNEKGKLINKIKGYNLMRDTSFHFDFIRSVLK